MFFILAEHEMPVLNIPESTTRNVGLKPRSLLETPAEYRTQDPANRTSITQLFRKPIKISDRR